MAYGGGEGVLPEGVGQALVDADLEDAGPAGGEEGAEAVGDVGGLVDPDALGAHGAADLGEGGVVGEIGAGEAVGVEVDLY